MMRMWLRVHVGGKALRRARRIWWLIHCLQPSSPSGLRRARLTDRRRARQKWILARLWEGLADGWDQTRSDGHCREKERGCAGLPIYLATADSGKRTGEACGCDGGLG